MKYILDLLFLIGTLSGLIHFVYRTNLFLFTVIGCGMALLVYFLVRNGKKYISIICFLCFFTFSFAIKVLYYQSLENVAFFALVFAHIGIGIYLVEQKNLVRVCTTIYMIIMIIILGYFISGIHPGDISDVSSENIVNYIYLAFSVLLIGVYYKERNKIIILPALLSTLVSLWTLGRSGIIASFILLAGTIIIKYKERLNQLSISLLLMFFSLTAYYIFNLVEKVTYNILFRFGERTTFIEGNSRVQIIEDYFNELDIIKIIFGLDFKRHFFAGFSNLHNSYLDIHSKFGVGGILVILILLIVIIFFLIAKQYLYFTLIFSLVFRATTDSVMLVGMYDYVLVFIVLIYVERISTKRQRDKLKSVSSSRRECNALNSSSFE